MTDETPSLNLELKSIRPGFIEKYFRYRNALKSIIAAVFLAVTVTFLVLTIGITGYPVNESGVLEPNMPLVAFGMILMMIVVLLLGVAMIVMSDFISKIDATVITEVYLMTNDLPLD